MPNPPLIDPLNPASTPAQDEWILMALVAICAAAVAWGLMKT